MAPLLSDRRLRWLLLISIALHGLLLTLLPDTVFHGSDSPLLDASIKALVVSAASPSKEIPKNVQPLPSSPRLERKPLETPRAPAATSVPTALPSPQAASLPARDNPAGGKAEIAPASPLAEIGADGLTEYRVALGREARRFKQEYDRRYDAIERDRQRGWEGRVEMTVRSRSGLAMPTVALAHSSGFSLLDEQALELIGRAVQATAVPAALQGQAFALPITLEFRMRSE